MRALAGNPIRILLLTSLVAGTAAVAPSRAAVWFYQDEQGVIHFSDVRRHPGFRLYRGGIRSARQRAPATPAPERAWDGVIRRAGRSHGLSPALVKAVVRAESAFDPRAVSPKGAQGLMQLMPATARELGVDDPFNPWQNIDGGTRYLSFLIQRFRGDLDLALAAYHAGEAVVRRYSGIPPYPETRRYVSRVLALYRRYDADFR